MNLRNFLTILLIICFNDLFSQNHDLKPDSLNTFIDGKTTIIDLDSLLDGKLDKNVLSMNSVKKSVITSSSKKTKSKSEKLSEAIGKHAFDSLLIATKEIQQVETPSDFEFSKNTPLLPIDSLILKANPFFIELVYWGLPNKFELNTKPDFQTMYYGFKATNLQNECLVLPKVQTPAQFIDALRQDARNEITRKAAHLYVFTFDKLPDPRGVKNHLINQRKLEKVHFVNEEESFSNDKKITLKKVVTSPWMEKATALAQFTQNSVSSNWYQGGTSNLAVLGILSGKLNYDNKKSIQWDNTAEWRLGFNTVSGDTLRSLSTNDDVLKFNSKLGINASGNWFYSGSVDFSTQFFNSYKGINSTVMKASFLTPVRLNIGVGFDYKYKKIFSLMLSPFAYKYIYINDAVKVDPNLFGMKAGEKVLSEVGSSLRALLSYPISPEIMLDTKLSFYTNYKKVEIDWEIVSNMVINRFLSTRISLNPRYDNTVIEKNGAKARIQYKQLLSVGFSHKFK